MLWAWADMSLLVAISRDACVDKKGLTHHWHKSENVVSLIYVVETGLSIQGGI